MIVCYVIFAVMFYALDLCAIRYGGEFGGTACICLAILTAGEVISWRCR